MRVLIETVAGSHLYGTSVEGSDVDLKTVFLPDGRDIILTSSPDITREEGPIDPVTGKHEWERELIPFKRFLDLLMEGQSVAMDIVFAPPHAQRHRDPFWDLVQEALPHLLNRTSDSALGYAKTQASRLAERGDRVIALRTVIERIEACTGESRLGPTIDAVVTDLPESIVSIVDIRQVNGRDLRHLSVCGRNFAETMPVGDALRGLKTLLSQYGERARRAADMKTADWKASMHALRVLDQTEELHSTGRMTFPRPNADLLKSIRMGELSRDAVEELVTTALDRTVAAAENSVLPEAPDTQVAEDLVVIAHRQQVELWLASRPEPATVAPTR